MRTFTKWSKPDREEQTLHDFMYMRRPKWSESSEGRRGWGGGELVVRGHGVLVGGWEGVEMMVVMVAQERGCT